MTCRTPYLNRRQITAGLLGASLLPRPVFAAEIINADISFEDFGKAARVIDGDSLIFESGLRVKLAGILAPAGKGSSAQAYVKRSTQALETLVAGRKIGLFYSGQTRDRYDRAIAQVFTLRPDGTADQWIQNELIKLGAARVRSYAGSVWRNDVLLKSELIAREAGRGLWQSADYGVRSPAPNALAQHVDSFQIVEGLIISTAQVRGQTYLNFGSDYRTDFTVSIARKHRKLFEKVGVDLVALEGARVRVRGWVELYNGPVMWLDHPDALEELTPIVT